MFTPIQNPTLQLNARGAAVRDLQTLLNTRVSADYRVLVDGFFGPKTESAVKAFQYSKLLTRDGVVGPKTWQALKTNQPAEHSMVRQGSRGASVQILQMLLKDARFYAGAIDGEFGPRTEAAVKKFQQDRQLKPVDGIVGRQTWAALAQMAQMLAFA